jgi:glycosyltransferase involved in cell wall biosynthesis
VATDVGTLRQQVEHGVDGLLCPPDDVGALAACLRQLYEPGVLPALRRGIRVPDPDQEWERYAASLEDTVFQAAA